MAGEEEEIEDVAEAIFNAHQDIHPTTVQWWDMRPEHKTAWYTYARAAILTYKGRKCR